MKSKTFTFVTLAPLLLLTAAGPAHPASIQPPPAPAPAGTPREPGRPNGQGRVSLVVAALDTSKDGEISGEEMAGAAVSLKALDKNNDGKLAADELRPAPTPVIVPASDIVERLMEFDRNGDGKLALAELPARMKTLLKQADTNKDGLLIQTELTAFTEKEEAVRRHETERREKQEAERQKRDGVPVPAPVRGPGRVQPIVAALDTNQDGEISADERASATASLKSLDKNSDGKLTAEELRPAPPPEPSPQRQ